MCSISEDIVENGIQNLVVEEKDINLFSKCNKCKTDIASIILRGKDVYCKNCFLSNTNHKFKAELGKSKLIRFQDRVLICHKIGHPSTSLLHFLQSGLNLDTPKKLRFEPVILFIEDQYQLSIEERNAVLKDIKNEILLFGFVPYFISLGKYVSNSNKIAELITQQDLIIKEDDGVKMLEIFGQHNSITVKKELRALYTRHLLLDSAKFLNCKFVFTPEICVEVASNLLSNLSLGRYQIANDTGFCDDRDETVKILRPLRQFDIKELAYYNIFNNIHPVVIRETKFNQFSSIQDLTSTFVKELQKNFPATISTIIRTGDKLILNKNDLLKCALCKVTFEIKENQLTADEAIDISILNSHGHFKEKDYLNYKTNAETCYCYTCTKLVKVLEK